MRGDVKKKVLSSVSERDVLCSFSCIQPISFLRSCGLSALSGQAKQLADFTRRFHDAMLIRRLRFWKLRKQGRWLLMGQPWSYLRLKAYSFFWLCEGAYGDFGGSVQNDGTRGLTR
jgi:hypothetical protein